MLLLRFHPNRRLPFECAVFLCMNYLTARQIEYCAWKDVEHHSRGTRSSPSLSNGDGANRCDWLVREFLGKRIVVGVSCADSV